MPRSYGTYTLACSPVIYIGGQVLCNAIPVRKAVAVRDPVTMAHESADYANENGVVAITGSGSIRYVLVACKPDEYDIE